MSFVNIATKLKTILDTIKADSNKHLSAVFNYDPGYTDSL